MIDQNRLILDSTHHSTPFDSSGKWLGGWLDVKSQLSIYLPVTKTVAAADKGAVCDCVSSGQTTGAPSALGRRRGLFVQRLKSEVRPFLFLLLQRFCGRPVVLLQLRKLHLRYGDVFIWKYVLPPFIVYHVQKPTRPLPTLQFTVHFSLWLWLCVCGAREVTLRRDAEILRELWSCVCNGASCWCFGHNSVLKSIRFYGRKVTEVLGAYSFCSRYILDMVNLFRWNCGLVLFDCLLSLCDQCMAHYGSMTQWGDRYEIVTSAWRRVSVANGAN